MSSVKRVFVEKKEGYDIAARHMFHDLKDFLGIKGLEKVRILIRYDVDDISEEDFQSSLNIVFSEPPVDTLSLETFSSNPEDKAFAIEYLPGQYDQRADSAAQAVQMITHGKAPMVRAAQVIVLSGDISPDDLQKAKKYLINPVDSHEASLEKPETLHETIDVPEDVAFIDGFISKNEEQLKALLTELGLAMSMPDLLHCQKYFRDEEKRDPSITEIRMLDTYWSDHCRHTTFLSKIKEVSFAEGKFTTPIKNTYKEYKEARKAVHGDKDKPESLMDIALMGMKQLRKEGKLDKLEVSKEINACSIVVDAEMTDGSTEPWLVMFKNETHNHPTEIEPFGGAATCLGGAIRDPLSGRSYVYQAMRVTGAGDPRVSLEDTMDGKLPQRKITTEAAHGYSSYGNQIGLATGIVNEIYDEGYKAKRMEIGAVIAAAPQSNVYRGDAEPGDVILFTGGRTGRDGCGGATGSSKSHTEESIETSGAEVQKGNPPTERKIQRLFRNPEVSQMIKVCNDFGAGGVSVAVGELADGLIIDLDAVPKKYDGLDGTELAISESQERMAVVLDKSNAEKFISLCEEENLEAVKIADVTKEKRVVMMWRGKKIVDLSREFIDTNGVLQETEIAVTAPDEEKDYFTHIPEKLEVENIKEAWLNNLSDLNVCSQKGLIERFDSTIGGGSVLLPFGGKYQITPAEAMAAKLPVLKGDTKTATIMSHGYDAALSHWSPFHSALYAVINSVAKLVAAGGDHTKAWLTLQEYFEKLKDEPTRWGKPFSALLGAYHAQRGLSIAAIGGKDSMSGTFEDLDVPPTLVSFAVAPTSADDVISPEFKAPKNMVIKFSVDRDEKEMPNFDKLNKTYSAIHKLIKNKIILSAHTISYGGIAAAVSKMSFGNRIGFKFEKEQSNIDLFASSPGSIICEVTTDFLNSDFAKEISWTPIGETTEEQAISINGIEISIKEAQNSWETPLEDVFPTKAEEPSGTPEDICYKDRSSVKPTVKIAKPKVFIPVFPGTNCEYDTARRFTEAGAEAETFVINNMTPNKVDESLATMAKKISESQIVMIPGGFSAGDEPEGSGKFIAAVFQNPAVKDAVMDLLKNRDGLMLGICNGFQALIKLGLVPYGEIRDLDEKSPTLTFNNIGRHVSCMVNTKVSSTLSPWFSNVNCGDFHSIAVSHGEGRFVASDEMMKELITNGQVATQYVDQSGKPTFDITGNPNGSLNAIEGITSPDGRVLGKMGHSERIGSNVAKNIHGDKDQGIFSAGVNYFK